MTCSRCPATGELLAIEVKPHTASDKDIAWSVLQAGMYADLFQRWADHAAARRTRFCTVWLPNGAVSAWRSGIAIQLAAPIKVRPVVALDRRAAPRAREKLAAVHAHLDAAGLGTDLYVRQVNLVGRLDPMS